MTKRLHFCSKGLTTCWAYGNRSKLTNASASVDTSYRYGYSFDDIGNRRSSAERGVQSAEYTANNLNQYTNIEYSAVSPATCRLSPTYDANGNQTLVKTATGIWQVEYNGENRPVLWTQGTNTISMSFDRMGRRVTKNDQRFVCNGYLQIANFRSTTTTSDYNYFVWDCTENVATRPLAWLVLRSLGEGGQRGTSVAYYTHDGNKNVSEVIASNNDVAAHYEYAPFGALTVSRGESAAANPFRFSSEYAEDDTATVYYNYRHYEPATERWMARDPIEESGGLGLYVFIRNHYGSTDCLGKADIPAGCYVAIDLLRDAYQKMRKANTKGADKWFHCMGMCRASYFCASVQSLAILRELFDQFKHLWEVRKRPNEEILSEMKKQLRDSMNDMEANRTGISCPFGKRCRCCCEKYHKQAPSIDPDDWF